MKRKRQTYLLSYFVQARTEREAHKGANAAWNELERQCTVEGAEARRITDEGTKPVTTWRDWQDGFPLTVRLYRIRKGFGSQAGSGRG